MGYPSSMTYKDNFKHNANDICHLFKQFFETVYEEPQLIHNENFDDIPNMSEALTEITIDKESLLLELRALDQTKGPGPDGIPNIFLKTFADHLADPLCIIFNKSLNEGYFPKNWRVSNITPIFKSGDRSKIENYRGIAILNAIPKLFEKVVTDQIVHFLVDKINEHQHGFQNGKSTSTNMVYYVSYLLLSMENNKQVDSIYTDFSKAFDKVNHKILEIKLFKIGIRGSVLN